MATESVTDQSVADHDSAGESAEVEVLDVDSPPADGEPWPLRPDESLGQSFRARHDGLCAIEVLVEVGPEAAGTVTCHLWGGGLGGRLLASRRVATAQLASVRFARFVWPPVADSANQQCAFSLETDTPGIAIYGSLTARLGDGSAYRLAEPIDGCLVFRAFAAAPDARLADRRQIETLLAERAALAQEILTARQTIATLHTEHIALEARLRKLLARLLAGGSTSA